MAPVLWLWKRRREAGGRLYQKHFYWPRPELPRPWQPRNDPPHSICVDNRPFRWAARHCNRVIQSRTSRHGHRGPRNTAWFWSSHYARQALLDASSSGTLVINVARQRSTHAPCIVQSAPPRFYYNSFKSNAAIASYKSGIRSRTRAGHGPGVVTHQADAPSERRTVHRRLMCVTRRGPLLHRLPPSVAHKTRSLSRREHKPRQNRRQLVLLDNGRPRAPGPRTAWCRSVCTCCRAGWPFHA
jgi:hypothetical protein